MHQDVYGMRAAVMRGESMSGNSGNGAAALAPGVVASSAPAVSRNAAPQVGRASTDDIAAILPAKAREVLLYIADTAQEENLVSRQLSSEIADLRLERGRLEQRLKTLAAEGHEIPIAAAKADAEAKIARINEKLARLDARYEKVNAEWQRSKRMETNLARWINNLGDVELSEIDMPQCQLNGKSFENAVEARRRRVREIAADMRKAKSAPITSAAAKAKARTEIEALAAAGRPDCMTLIEYGEPIAWPMVSAQTIFSGINGGSPTWSKTTNALGLLALMFRDDLLRVVDAEIEQIANDAEALTDERRAEIVATCARDLFAAQLEEEALIRAAAAQGLKIPRREDADPCAVLGLSVSEPVAA